MTKKFIDVNGLHLAYIELNPGKAHTLFFIHGNSGSSNSWRLQFESPLFIPYRIIAMDLPGHGESSPGSDPYNDYGPIGMGKIVAKMIALLANDNPYTLVGFSYGCNLAAETLLFLEPAGLVCIGSSAIGSGVSMETMLIHPELSIYFKEGLTREDVKRFIGERMSTSETTLDSYVNDYMSVDVAFRPQLFQNAVNQNFSDEIELLKNYSRPVLYIFGKSDNLVNPDYMDQLDLNVFKKIHKLESAGHYVHIDRADACNALISEYLEAVALIR